MSKYLLDTNICIFFFKGRFKLDEKFIEVGVDNCFISEITLAELKFGAENSANPEKHRKIVQEFQNKIQVIPIFNSINLYAKEKARLRKLGTPIDEFDLLIDHLLQTYQVVGVAAEVYVVEMFQNSAEHLYEDPYPTSAVGKFTT